MKENIGQPVRKRRLSPLKVLRLTSALIPFILTGGCGPIIEGLTQTPPPIPTRTSSPLPATVTPFPTETPTKTMEPTLEPFWQQTIETQDPQDKFFQVIDGKPVIDLYDTQTQENIVLNQESVKKTTTTDGLNPDILTAQDANNNLYALNPNYGWFKVPEVQTDPSKWQEYTDLPYNFFQEGTANIILALTYANNPTISPDAAIPHYWADYSATGGGPFVYISLHPGIATKGWPWHDLAKSSYFTLKQRPFVFPGYFKTTTPDGKIIYLPGQVSNNPTQENPSQTICLFKGFDEKVFKDYASFPGFLNKLFNTIGPGQDFVFILAPPEELNGNSIGWFPTKVRLVNTPCPDVAGLQKRGQLIDFFSPQDKQTILTVLDNGLHDNPSDPQNIYRYFSMPITSLPSELSKYILLSGFGL
jgi:hypothetical protein